MNLSKGETTIFVSCCLIIVWQTSVAEETDVKRVRMYTRTDKLKKSDWATFVNRTVVVDSALECAGHCVHMMAVKNDCNAFAYVQSSNQCELAVVKHLEERHPDLEMMQPFYVDARIVKSLGVKCHGSKYCCRNQPDGKCSNREGNCHSDDECKTHLLCRHNCLTDLGKSGGMWDSGDRCCSPRCTSYSQCPVGDGPCSRDDQCLGSSYCVRGCINRLIFPEETFPSLTMDNKYGYDKKCCTACTPDCCPKDCPQGFRADCHGKCYRIRLNKIVNPRVKVIIRLNRLSWADAKAKCQADGAFLTEPKSLDQLMDAIELIDTNGFVWVGASDLASLGDYVWEHSQTPFEATSELWDVGEPNREHERCVLINLATRRLADGPCGTALPSVCEKGPATT